MADEDYDPYIHRVEMLKAPTNNLETIYHLFKSCLGTGLLALPHAFKTAGMINGIVSTILIGILCTYLIHILLKGQYLLCKKRRIGLLRYGDSMRVACEEGPEAFRSWGSFASGFTDFTLIFYQTGCCCIYIVYCVTSLKQIVEVYIENEKPIYLYALMLFAPFFILLLISKNLKILAPFSLIANLTTMLTFGVIYYYNLKGLDAKFTDRKAVGRLVDYPLVFGTVLFSLQSVPLIIAIENNMATPASMRNCFGPLNIAFGSLTFLYIITAVLGFWRYGDEVESIITMNFPITEKFAQVIVASYCFAVYITYGLNAYVPINILLDLYIFVKLDQQGASDKKKALYEYGLRTFFAVFTFFLATSIPFFGLFISLVGSLGLSCLGVIFPAFIDIAANWEDKRTRPGTFGFWRDILLILIGMFALFSGGYSSILGIVNLFREKK